MGEPWVKMKRGLFYCPHDSGYTGIRDKAGRYSEEEARAEARLEGVTAMPLSEAPEFSPACFDDLALQHVKDQLAAMQHAARKAIEIIDRNLYHQREKVQDASEILRQALNP